MNHLNGCSILVVEDSDDMWRLVSICLRRAGAFVERAVNGAEALVKARESTYKAILMDMQMPVMDGLEATRRLRARGVTSPILALTTNQTSTDIANAIEAGCDAHFAKPCYGNALITRVASYC